MFALLLEETPTAALETRLQHYGINEIVRTDKGRAIQEVAKSRDSQPDGHVLLVGCSDKLSNLDVRRLTLNTVRLPQRLSVWDNASQENLVAARVPWEPLRQSWLESTATSPIDQLRDVLNTNKCTSFALQDFTSGDSTRVGGSFAKSGVSKYFRKTATGRGAIKLGNEMQFYRSMPDNVAAHYPELLFIKEKAQEVTFGIQYHNVPNVRDLLLNCEISAEDAAQTLRQVLEFEYKQAYISHLQLTPPNYLEDYHFHRVWRRIQISAELDPTFVKLTAAKWLHVNGKKLPNIPAMLHALESSKDANAKLAPAGVSKYVHSDLHLENILVDRENKSFWLVDPRGYPVCDIYYDLGKLAHSYHSNYDLLHEGRHEAEYAVHSESDSATIDFRFKCPTIVETYSKLDNLMTGTIHEVMGATTEEQKRDIDIKTRFNEAMHFCSDMPFHIHRDATPNIAMPIYATGALLLAETLELMGVNPLDCADQAEAGLARLEEMSHKKWVFEA